MKLYQILEFYLNIISVGLVCLQTLFLIAGYSLARGYLSQHGNKINLEQRKKFAFLFLEEIHRLEKLLFEIFDTKKIIYDKTEDDPELSFYNQKYENYNKKYTRSEENLTIIFGKLDTIARIFKNINSDIHVLKNKIRINYIELNKIYIDYDNSINKYYESECQFPHLRQEIIGLGKKMPVDLYDKDLNIINEFHENIERIKDLCVSEIIKIEDVKK